MVDVIKFKDVSFGYEDKSILENVNFNINQGDYIGIVGPNGCGKTTLLKLIINELNPTKGKIKILDKDTTTFSNWEKIGYVNQKSNSFSTSFPATVTEVVAMDLAPKIGLFKRIKKKHLEEVYKVLKLVGIYELKDKLIGSLSGGQQQKVFISRALMRNPKILILDEPTVGIDLNGQKEFYEILKRLNENLNLTIVIVSHDLFIVKEEVKKIAVLKNKNIKVIDNIDNDLTKSTLLDLFEI
ncbi:metal ABC transporter ATP-binding protein [Romboutsia sp. CE17]|uniref:metal ABC transporter ATP-binding protein n=1 Tax=Romboutsia sp. CE17 TaxID=2724150 RepID=UPI001442C82B|nr:metal ABC transporter ATP-binding protein [Romboutsia sp. CE17]QJA08982.1 metal ABC transporter ATP-binding protein [Romboutsia sp. CE17]